MSHGLYPNLIQATDVSELRC